jgi:hypothetical protein
MEEPKYIKNIVVKCDKCDWSLPVAYSQAKDWHNKSCPSCNDCVIITDDDLAIIEGVKLLSDLQEKMVNSGCLTDNDKFIDIRINTAKAEAK